eukprot:13004765-Ditylum_brightwellii.AAC.1
MVLLRIRRNIKGEEGKIQMRIRFLSLLCSFNNLTCDTSVGQQAFASKASSYSIVKGDEKESYGWFIETDTDNATPLSTHWRRYKILRLHNLPSKLQQH